MESMQSVLPPTVSPGWNDPPNLGTTIPSGTPSRLANLRKRLVDPSISGTSVGVGDSSVYSGHGSPYGTSYAANQNTPNRSSYGMEFAPVSHGVPTSAPVPSPVTTQSLGNNYSGDSTQQMTTNQTKCYANALISPSYVPQHSLVNYSSSTTHSQPQPGTAAGNILSPASPSGQQFQHVVLHPSSNLPPMVYNGATGNQQFFQQHQYHEAPPISRS